MINENILSMFKSRTGDYPYSIIITDIKQESDCNQESVIFTVYQINKEINEIIQNANVTERKLHITGDLSLDENDLYKTNLLGYLSDEQVITKIDEPKDKMLSHYIEILDTKLSKSIDITFNKEYEEEPKIFFNIEKEYESLYKSHSIEWKTKIEKIYYTEEQNGQEINLEKEKKTYIGATISFNYLKTKKSYPNISIIIIGDLKTKEENNESEENSILEEPTENDGE